ncbi:MAG: bifunctional glycosyltransferase family 2 protein/class I SAM-dependent methyltransferase [Clostridia bacterium]|nr:bifunctional glycosyltransferase family 2 protein/class I SAM-dependent methyltransferase [Clostridia bacterium]
MINEKLSSIIILTHNQLEYTKLCLDSIRKYTHVPYEIIVVDNASTDGTVGYLEQQNDIRLIKNIENKGFAAGCNQGIMASGGEYVVLLNNDTVVTCGWLSNLISCFSHVENAAAVGPVTNNIYGSQKIRAEYDDISKMQEFAEQFNNQPPKYEKVLKLVGFCMLIKRQMLDIIGLLDESFKVGNYEDDDLCVRIILRGFDLYICRNTFIHHFGRTTFDTLNVSYQSIMETNKNVFKEKWGYDFSYFSFVNPNILDNIPESASKVLHIGCSTGALALSLKNRQSVEVIGMDACSQMQKIAERFLDKFKQTNLEYSCWNMEEGYFDAIIVEYTLEYILNPSAFLQQLAKVLQTDGILIVRVPNANYLKTMEWLMNDSLDTDLGVIDKKRVILRPKGYIKELLHKNGFQSTNELRVYKVLTEDEEHRLKQLHKCFREMNGECNFEEHGRTYQYIFVSKKL